MSLNFNDTQLKTATKEILEIPARIALYQAQKVAAEQEKVNQFEKDDANKVFYSHFKGIVRAYFDERRALDNLTYTEYQDSILEDSARQAAGNLHYPTSPPWPNMQPKLLAENNGNPTSNAGNSEVDQLPQVGDAIDFLKNGFNDGTNDTTIVDPYANGSPIDVTVGGFTIGQRVVVDNLNISTLGEITAIDVPSGAGAQSITITEIVSPNGSLPALSRIRAFHNGFSNAEREGTSTPYAPEVLAHAQAMLDVEVSVWETYLIIQKTALDINDAKGTEATQNISAKNNVIATQTIIDTWQAAPDTGANIGRFGDTVLTPLQTMMTVRQSQSAARAIEITDSLGSVSQAGDGVISGSGNFHSLFKWINLRCGKAGGSLFQYYSMDLIVEFTDKKIDTEQAKKSEYDALMIAISLSEDADGTEFITLENVTGLSIGNQIKVFDDDSAVIDVTIVGISGNILELDITVSNLFVAKLARISKEL